MKKLGTKRAREAILEIARKYIYDVRMRGDLECRMNDEEDVLSATVGEIEAALEAAYRAGQESWKN